MQHLTYIIAQNEPFLLINKPCNRHGKPFNTHTHTHTTHTHTHTPMMTSPVAGCLNSTKAFGTNFVLDLTLTRKSYLKGASKAIDPHINLYIPLQSGKKSWIQRFIIVKMSRQEKRRFSLDLMNGVHKL